MIAINLIMRSGIPGIRKEQMGLKVLGGVVVASRGVLCGDKLSHHGNYEEAARLHGPQFIRPAVTCG